MAQTRTQTQTRPAQQQPPWEEKPAQPVAKTEPNGNGHKSQSAEERVIEFMPLGEGTTIKLTIAMVRQFLCQPTKQGHMPSDADVVKFMMVCRQRRLNPWVGDCYLLGYDTKYGPKFSIVVAVQALLKRAEVAKEFDGIESGVVVVVDGEVVERQGDLVLEGERLVGGWALVYRKDRSKPFYQRLKLETFRRNTQQWDSDTAGMIVKCSESASLRQAFPSDIGGLYLEQELHDATPIAAAAEPAKQKVSTASELSERLAGQQRVVGKAPVSQEATQERQEAHGEHDQTAEASGEETPADAQDAAPDAQDGSQDESREAAGAGGDGEAGSREQAGLRF